MKRNPIKDMEDKHLFNNALTDVALHLKSEKIAFEIRKNQSV